MILTSSLHKDSATTHVCWVLPNPSPGSFLLRLQAYTPVAQRTSLPQQQRHLKLHASQPSMKFFHKVVSLPILFIKAIGSVIYPVPPSQNVGSFHIQSPIFSHHVHHSFTHAFIHSKTLTEHLLQVRHCARCWWDSEIQLLPSCGWISH